MAYKKYLVENKNFKFSKDFGQKYHSTAHMFTDFFTIFSWLSSISCNLYGVIPLRKCHPKKIITLVKFVEVFTG